MEEILKQKIIWEKHRYNDRYFYSYLKDKSLILLRINNFPDEPLYTVIYGLTVYDMDEKPLLWEVPFHSLPSE